MKKFVGMLLTVMLMANVLTGCSESLKIVDNAIDIYSSVYDDTFEQMSKNYDDAVNEINDELGITSLANEPTTIAESISTSVTKPAMLQTTKAETETTTTTATKTITVTEATTKAINTTVDTTKATAATKKTTTATKSTETTTKKTTTTTKTAETTTKKATTTVAEKNNDAMVWIPQSGSKYHSYAGCSNMKNPTQVSLDKAKSMGYEPCKRCH